MSAEPYPYANGGCSVCGGAHARPEDCPGTWPRMPPWVDGPLERHEPRVLPLHDDSRGVWWIAGLFVAFVLGITVLDLLGCSAAPESRIEDQTEGGGSAGPASVEILRSCIDLESSDGRLDYRELAVCVVGAGVVGLLERAPASQPVGTVP